MFAIVPRETFGCWFFAVMPFCCSAGRSAGRSAVLLVYACLLLILPLCRPLCRSAGRSAVLLVYACLLLILPLCRPLCRFAGLSAVLVVCSLRFGLPGDSRLPFSLSACAWCFAFRWLHCFRAFDLCSFHLPCFHVFSCPVLNLGCLC